MVSSKDFVIEVLDLTKHLAEGSLALFPTDTLPALASLPENANQLWKIKRRPLQKPLILMGASHNELFEFVHKDVIHDALRMAKLYWPGPLTLVVPAQGSALQALNPEGLTLGLRVPQCELALDLLGKSGPLATTSANLSGGNPAKTEQEARSFFPEIPMLGPLPWPESSGMASTVVRWHEGNWDVLRKGSLSLSEL